MSNITGLAFDEFIEEVRKEITPVFKPKFRSVSWKEIGNTAVDHSYLVKGLLVNAEKSVMAGESQAGKSFLATDLALSVARGVPFQGFKVPQSRGVVYICAESAGGVVNLRIPAYKRYFEMHDEPDLPIQFIVQAPDFFNSKEDTANLIKDIKHYASTFRVPLGLIVVDTFAASTPGADENKGADVSRILNRFDDMRDETGAHVMVVHHMNAEGSKLPGHTSLVGNFDTIMVVNKTEERDNPTEGGTGREVRTVTLSKRKDGAQGGLRKFVLRVVELGTDDEGDPVTSCVCDVPENMPTESLQTAWREVGMYQIPGRAGFGMGTRALKTAFTKYGRRAPAGIVAEKSGGADVIILSDWMKEFMALADNKEKGESEQTVYNRVKGQRDRIIDVYTKDNIIGKEGEWIWRTKRLIQGIDPPPRKAPVDVEAINKKAQEEAKMASSAPVDPKDPFAELPFA